MTEKQRVLFGTAGWSYPDWQGTVYPDRKPRGFDDLRYISEYFDAVELNVTFYRPPQPNTAKSWARRTADRKRFKFTAKLHQRFTHQREERWTAAQADEYKRGIAPLAEAGKLGGILLQFPWSFKNTPPDRKWLEAVIEEFKEFPLFVEIRHDSWRDDTLLEYLDGAGVGFVNIDQPVFRDSLPPTRAVTGNKGYIRLHGRNADAWFDERSGRNERYNYLYDEDELAEWVEKLRDVAARAESVFLISNNHYRGQAAVNSLELMSLFEDRKVPVPHPLLETYPRLERIAAGEETESQGRLL